MYPLLCTVPYCSVLRLHFQFHFPGHFHSHFYFRFCSHLSVEIPQRTEEENTFPNRKAKIDYECLLAWHIFEEVEEDMVCKGVGGKVEGEVEGEG